MSVVLWRLGLVSYIALPLVWLLATSIKSRLDILAPVPRLLFSPTLEHYYAVLFERGLARAAANGGLLAMSSSIAVVVVAAPVAYVISRRLIRAPDRLFLAAMTTKLAPPAAVALPLYWLLSQAGMAATFPAILLVHVAANLAVGLLLLRVTLDAVPREIEEAAALDGFSELEGLYRLVIPTARAGVLATVAIVALFSWNELALTAVIAGYRWQTMPVSLLTLVTPQGTFWGEIAALSVLALVPVLVLASLTLALRRRARRMH